MLVDYLLYKNGLEVWEWRADRDHKASKTLVDVLLPGPFILAEGGEVAVAHVLGRLDATSQEQHHLHWNDRNDKLLTTPSSPEGKQNENYSLRTTLEVQRLYFDRLK